MVGSWLATRNRYRNRNFVAYTTNVHEYYKTLVWVGWEAKKQGGGSTNEQANPSGRHLDLRWG